MGWLAAIFLFIVSLATGNGDMMIASGLFAIAGSIEFKKME